MTRADTRRKFQINPGPLKTYTKAPKLDHNAGRCIALTRDGTRCLRDAVDDDYCRQHGKDRPELCPMGCGRTTDDAAGGPCSSCWNNVS
jgi:hypothetical protein